MLLKDLNTHFHLSKLWMVFQDGILSVISCFLLNILNTAAHRKVFKTLLNVRKIILVITLIKVVGTLITHASNLVKNTKFTTFFIILPPPSQNYNSTHLQSIKKQKVRGKNYLLFYVVFDFSLLQWVAYYRNI